MTFLSPAAAFAFSRALSFPWPSFLEHHEKVQNTALESEGYPQRPLSKVECSSAHHNSPLKDSSRCSRLLSVALVRGDIPDRSVLRRTPNQGAAQRRCSAQR